MKIVLSHQDDVLVVAVSGSLTNQTAPLFDEKLQSECHTHTKKVVVDLSDLTLISSAGLRSLLQLAKRLMDVKGQLVLAGVQQQVDTVLGMTGLDVVLKTTADVASGLRLLQTHSR
jgi:anti-anti-sigma factor